VQVDTLNVALGDLPRVITAVGGLGTAAMGLVDACKTIGVNHIGFPSIKKLVHKLTPGLPAVSQQNVINTLKGNWYNGTDIASQKAIAKTLLKANLADSNAPALAAATNVDPAGLKAVAANLQSQTALVPALSDLYGRFDLGLTALLDATYRRSDASYRNWTRVMAGSFAIVIALWGAKTVGISCTEALIVGILAVPLAPVAKDLSSALAAAVNSLQQLKK
jgi:hypothetical protein